MEKDIYTYSDNCFEYPSLETAKKVYDGKVDSWKPYHYDKCEFHGDSLLGLKDGKKVCEIKFLMNHKFCNPWDDKACGYIQDEE